MGHLWGLRHQHNQHHHHHHQTTTTTTTTTTKMASSQTLSMAQEPLTTSLKKGGKQMGRALGVGSSYLSLSGYIRQEEEERDRTHQPTVADAHRILIYIAIQYHCPILI